MTANTTQERRVPGPERRLFDLREAAAYMGMSYWSARELVLAGRVPHLRLNKKILTDKRDWDSLIVAEKMVGV